MIHNNNNKALTLSSMSFNYSVYIPRVFKGITQDQIRGTFLGQNIGSVARVDLLKVYNEKKEWVYNKAFVHFNEFFNNEDANKLRQDIESGHGRAKIIYEPNRFWMILPNASEKVPEVEQNNISDPSPIDKATQPMLAPYPHPMFHGYYIPQHIMTNPYSYMEPPSDIGNRDKYYTNYTAAHHSYFNQFPSLQTPMTPCVNNGDQTPRPSLNRLDTVDINNIPK